MNVKRALPSTRTRLWVLLGIVCSLILLAIAFWGVAWADLWRSLSRVRIVPLLLAIVMLCSNLVIRALRWQALLAPLVRATLADALSYTLIGYLVNNVLGLRLGEVVRAGLLGEKLATRKAGVFATVIVERLLDVLSMLAFVAALLVTLDLPAIVRNSILIGEVLAVGLTVVLGLLAWRGKNLDRLIPRFLPAALRARLSRLLASFVQGLQVLKSGRQLLIATFWSILSWAAFAASTALFMASAGLDYLPWQAPLLVIVVTNLGSAIPSSPGFVGGYHFLAVFSLSLWAVPKNDALSFAILIHGIDYVVVTGLGALALLRENIAFSQLRQRVRGHGDAAAPPDASVEEQP